MQAIDAMKLRNEARSKHSRENIDRETRRNIGRRQSNSDLKKMIDIAKSILINFHTAHHNHNNRANY